MNPFATDMVTIDAETQEVLHLLYGWSPPRQLPDRGTTDHAVLGVTSSTNFTGHIEIPRMVWKGVAHDPGIYESTLLSGAWTSQQRIPGIGSSHSPALAKIDVPGSVPPLTGLLMAWKGVGDDKNLYWTQNLDNGWEAQHPFPSARSDTRPALANVAGRIFIACAGSDGDRNIYWAMKEGNGDWSRFALTNTQFQTTDSPALVGIGDQLFMFWKGKTENFEAFWSVTNTTQVDVASFAEGFEAGHWQPQRRIEYIFHDASSGGDPPPHAIGTGGALTATQCGDTIFLAWRGVGIDDTTYVTVFSAGEFGGPIHIPEFRTSVGPAVTKWNDNILMAWKGTEDDRTIHWAQL